MERGLNEGHPFGEGLGITQKGGALLEATLDGAAGGYLPHDVALLSGREGKCDLPEFRGRCSLPGRPEGPANSAWPHVARSNVAADSMCPAKAPVMFLR